MISIQGKGVSGGVACGPLFFLRRADGCPEKTVVLDVAAEKQRAEAAIAASVEQLVQLAEQCRQSAGEETAMVFETHAMLAEDEDFFAGIFSRLEEEHCNAAWAVYHAGQEFAAELSALDDAYMQARSADVLDVAQRIVKNLLGETDDALYLTQPVILAAEDLAPSQTLQLDKSKILGFVTRAGSENSHTAILARAMGIPAICALGAALTDACHGQNACMDGQNGQLILQPDDATQALWQEKLAAQRTRQQHLHALRGLADVTPDGREVMLYCNIASEEDVQAVLANDGRGIGLFRSEFLYLRASTPPTEDEQFQAYRAVASAMEGKRVVIRTLDIGADKQVDYFNMKSERNPALGVRGIRLCLNRPEIFRTQLRALYRASAYGKIAIMFPMISSVWEVEQCKALCRSVMEELRAQELPFNEHTELGIMIETPAAVFLAQELAQCVDFFSVGTNDLTQYTLACDRQSADLGRFYDPHHPALLRALRMAAEAAHCAGIWIGICGELAADCALLPAFLALGIDELSVAPASLLPLRAAIRQTVAGECDLRMLEY